jgi:hypothetical protein
MDDLMWSDLTFCQCFLSRDTKKLMLRCTFCARSSALMPTLPTATDRHKTFFIWNLMVALTSSILAVIDSWWVRRPGNLPALFKPGPSRRGICLISDSEARKASYFLAGRKMDISLAIEYLKILMSRFALILIRDGNQHI